MKNGYIYTLSCPISKKVRYIGQTINPKQRLNQHLYLNNKGKKFHHINWLTLLKSQNLKPIFEILDEVLVEDLNYWEKFYISQFKCWGFDLTNTSSKDYFRVHRVNMSKGKKVLCYKKEGLYKTFTSARECAKELNLSFRTISCICNNTKKVTQNDFTFSFSPLTNMEIEKRFSHTVVRKSIVAKSVSTNEKHIFNSQVKASEILNVNFRNINQCLKGIRKTCGGFTWEYLN